MIFKEQFYKAIVPISCGSRRGTAFFVEPGRLLTARHVVIESLLSNTPVEVVCREISRVCSKVEVLKDSDLCDVAILTLPAYEHEYCFPLLSLPINSEKRLFVAGFPLEIGNGQDLFDFEIHRCSEVTNSEYDVFASPKELIAFSSYKGFSGSPVVTEEGFAVGVITDQLARVVGFSTARNWSDSLQSKGLQVYDNWEDYDKTPYGYARSVEQTKIATKLAGDRYSPKLHIEHESLKTEFNVFCSKCEQNRLSSIYPSVEEWYEGLLSAYPFVEDEYEVKYQKGEFASLAHRMARIRNRYNERRNEENKAFREIVPEVITQLKANLKLLDEIFYSSRDVLECQCAFLHGKAGSGKTHFLCAFAENHRNEFQTYLVFGNQFDNKGNFLQQIEFILGFPEGIKGLNDYMDDKNRLAVIIVDAINEGVGFEYWRDQLGGIPDSIKPYKNIRLILSARIPNNDDLLDSLNGWAMRLIEGFANTEDAIDLYFDKFGVDSKFKNSSFYEFSNPLFLRIFCISYHRIPLQFRDRITKLQLFLLYLKVRNKDVAEIVNEDEYKNILTPYLLELAKHSVFDSLTGEVTREFARDVSTKTYPYHLWTNSLLYACLKETLLLEAKGDDRRTHCVDFEYDNLGDFLKVFAFLKSDWSGQNIKDWLVAKKQSLIQNRVNRTRFVHFVGALLSVDTPELKDFSESVLEDSEWELEKLDTLQYRGPLNSRIIAKFLDESIEKILPFLISNTDDYTYEAIVGLHNELKKLELPVRDLKWSIKVNDLYDWNGRETLMSLDYKKKKGVVVNDENQLKIVVLLAWMTSSSYPELRAILIRHITDVLSDNPKLAKTACDLFYDCNDPYVLRSVYCAIYGMTLRIRDIESICAVAEAVYNYCYAEGATIPNDLLVRQWSMKIIERAASLNPDFSRWRQVQPPFTTQNDPLHIADGIEEIGKDYFGNSDGSHRLYKSLLGFSDFNRYIIGTNNNHESRVFYDKTTGEAIQLSEIEKMIAVRVMQLGWNDELGEYDNGKLRSRSENEIERIGKKYQWLAFYDIMGQLTDVCGMRHDYYSMQPPKDREIHYPWYSDEYDYFDPSMQKVNNQTIGFEIHPLNPLTIDSSDERVWINNNQVLPNLNLLFKDNLNRDWVLLCGYDSASVDKESFTKEFSLFVNSAFVKKEDNKKYNEWSKTQNFYGRWMPERHDCIDFRWNEYPWSDSFLNYFSQGEDWEEPYRGDCPVKIMLSYVSQLQEDKRGFDDSKDFSSTVYMPCPDMMKKMGWYTAERGVIRTLEEDKIVAVDSRLAGIEHSGLLVLKSVLDEYLSHTDYMLAFFILGEKFIHDYNGNGTIKELSCSISYTKDGGFVEMAPLRVMEKEPLKPVEPDLI